MCFIYSDLSELTWFGFTCCRMLNKINQKQDAWVHYDGSNCARATNGISIWNCRGFGPLRLLPKGWPGDASPVSRTWRGTAAQPTPNMYFWINFLEIGTRETGLSVTASAEERCGADGRRVQNCTIFYKHSFKDFTIFWYVSKGFDQFVQDCTRLYKSIQYVQYCKNIVRKVVTPYQFEQPVFNSYNNTINVRKNCTAAMYAAKQFSSRLLSYCTSWKQIARIGTELQPFVQYFYNVVQIV